MTMKLSHESEERHRQIIDLLSRGLTYAEIGEAVGLSRQRIKQLVAQPSNVVDVVRRKAKSRCKNCAVETQKGFIYSPDGSDVSDLSNMDKLIYLCLRCYAERLKAGTGKSK
jgi:hypothetical protein